MTHANPFVLLQWARTSGVFHGASRLGEISQVDPNKVVVADQACGC